MEFVSSTSSAELMPQLVLALGEPKLQVVTARTMEHNLAGGRSPGVHPVCSVRPANLSIVLTQFRSRAQSDTPGRIDRVRQNFGNKQAGQFVHSSLQVWSRFCSRSIFDVGLTCQGVLRRDLRLIKCKFGAIRVNYHSAKVGKGVSMSPVRKSQVKLNRHLVSCPAN